MIKGRSPECAFWNLCLWNQFLHTYNYDYERVTINGGQVQYDDDGSWTIVVAGRDGFQRLNDLPDRVIPREQLEAPVPTEGEFRRGYALRAVQGRGALRHELILCLRAGRALNAPRARSRRKTWAHVTPEALTSERPAATSQRYMASLRPTSPWKSTYPSTGANGGLLIIKKHVMR